MRCILVLSNRQIRQILEAFSELGNNINRNWAIIFVLDRQQYMLQYVFFFAEGDMWFQHAAAAKTYEHHVETAIA